MHIILQWIISAAVLLGIAYLVPGITVHSFYSALIAALILGLVNVVIKPVILLLTLPANILTLGLLTFVINAFLFWFAATIVKGFDVAGFWPAFWGALLMSIASWLLAGVINK
jgi:putative membrane protein